MEKLHNPNPEEIKTAEDSLSDEQALLSSLRELVHEKGEALPTKNFLERSVSEAPKYLRALAEIFTKREDFIRRSTIIRGKTVTDTGEPGQAFSIYLPLPSGETRVLNQVYVCESVWPDHPKEAPTIQAKGSPFIVETSSATPPDFYEVTLHELVHSFTTYLIRAHEKHDVEWLNGPEQRFFSVLKSLYDTRIEQLLSRGEKPEYRYADNMHEFCAKVLTSDKENTITYQHKERLLRAFEEFYLQNERNIESFATVIASVQGQNKTPPTTGKRLN